MSGDRPSDWAEIVRDKFSAAESRLQSGPETSRSKVLEVANAILAAIWDLDNANAPMSPGDCRAIAKTIGEQVAKLRGIP